jgi:hypothetical protein
MCLIPLRLRGRFPVRLRHAGPELGRHLELPLERDGGGAVVGVQPLGHEMPPLDAARCGLPAERSGQLAAIMFDVGHDLIQALPGERDRGLDLVEGQGAARAPEPGLPERLVDELAFDLAKGRLRAEQQLVGDDSDVGLVRGLLLVRAGGVEAAGDG